MPAVKGGSYGGVSASGRQEERRRRLLAAGLQVMGTEGLAAATVRAICREAGLSSRFFYESFPGVEELAVALFDQIFTQATETVLAAVAEAPPDLGERNRIAIKTFVRELTDDPRVARFTLMESLGSEALARRRLAMVRTITETMLQRKQAPGADRKTGSYREVAATVVVGGLIELLVAWMHGMTDSDLPHLVQDYVQLCNEVAQTTGSSLPAGRPEARPS